MQHHLFLGFDAIKSKSLLTEKNIITTKLSRKQIKRDILENKNLEQLASLGILFLAEKKTGCNILDDEWLDIYRKLSYIYKNNEKK